MKLGLQILNDVRKVKQEKKIFVIGFPKTGTTSIEFFLKDLGYRVCNGHWNNNHTNFLLACYYFEKTDEILNVTRYFDAFADAPWGGTEIYKVLVEMYPNAYYIFTIREVEKWYLSLINMYLQIDKNLKTAMETMRSFGAYGNYLYMKKFFGISELGKKEELLMQKYDEHNKKVRDFFSSKDYNFLEIDITKDKLSEQKIKKFLNISDSSCKLKHLNKGIYQL